MPTTLRIDGLDAFLDELATLAPDLADEAGPLSEAIANDAAQALRAAVPYVTGRLRRSIGVERQASGVRVAATIAMTAPYAGHVEFGTRYVRARPNFTPITRRARERFVKAVAAQARAHGLTIRGEGA